VNGLAGGRDSHALSRLVDFDQKVGVGDLAERKHRDGGGGQQCDEAVYAHRWALQPQSRLALLAAAMGKCIGPRGGNHSSQAAARVSLTRETD
jgi:hypothetical protein